MYLLYREKGQDPAPAEGERQEDQPQQEEKDHSTTGYDQGLSRCR